MEQYSKKHQRGRFLSCFLLVLAVIVGLGFYTGTLTPLAQKIFHSPQAEHNEADRCVEQDHAGHDHAEHEHGLTEHENETDENESEQSDTTKSETARVPAKLALKEHDEHAEHDEHEEHDHEQEENTDSLALDDAALFNIGIGPQDELTLEVQDYQKSFRIPGIVREIPGQSINNIAATVSGIVTRVEAKQGDSLCPGAPILEIQLTHEDAIQCQTDLIALLQKRDVLQMEEERLGSLADGIAPKQQRELLLQKITNEAAIQSQRNLLKIHGFTDAMIEETVLVKRQAITALIVRAPEISEEGIALPTKELHSENDQNEHYQILEKLLVNQGDSVRMGDILCQISDLRILQIEGKVFASDENIVNDALLRQSPVTALFADAVAVGARETMEHLTIARVDSFIAQETQTVSCWITIPNHKLVRTGETAPNITGSSCDQKSIHWRFKPGQRCELAIGYETMSDCFVLPPEAVAMDRSNAFVFELVDIHEGKKVWTKRPVRVLYRASDAVVVAHDETIRPGIKVAKTGAEQLYVALGSGSGKLQSACEHDH